VSRPRFRAALWRKRSRRFRSGLLALAIGIVFAFPFYWVIVTSLSSTNRVYQFPPDFLPGTVTGNYSRAWGEATWVRFFVNTLFIAGATVALVLITSLLAGFALGVTRFRGRELVLFAVLSILMIPKVVLLIPDYVVLSKLHWLDTYWAQIVPWGASVFGIFLLRQFFRSLPQEIVEAAELDGATQMQFLRTIAAPLARPALITIGLYVFIASWNSFLWPFIMTSNPKVQPIEVGLSTFYGTNGTDWTGLSAAVVFTTLPVMVIFMIAQRRLVEGASATTGANKG
jgi:multiple sugar transport system permease protein